MDSRIRKSIHPITGRPDPIRADGPWRFKIDSDTITVSADSKREGFRISRKLDCGIAMLHLELGARAESIDGSWEFLEYPDVAIHRIN